MLRYRGGVRRWLGERLERGAWDSALPRAAARVWEALAQPTRALHWPPGVRVVGVSGPSLGGDGKTPVTLALARALVAAGERVAVVARAYPRRPRRAGRVAPGDEVAHVGDEPLLLARELDADGVEIWIAPSRQLAVSHAGRVAPWIVVDGLLQSAPARLFASLLVVPDDAAWLARCPPAGPRRAGRTRLLAGADHVVALGPAPHWQAAARAAGRAFWTASQVCDGAISPRGQRRALTDLSRLRCGVCLTIARPERVLDQLRRAGVQPARLELHGDHAVPAAGRDPVPDLDLWLCTAKCAVKLGDRYRGAPVWILDHRANLPPELIARLLSAATDGKARPVKRP